MLPAPFDLNKEDLELLYRALGRGLVVWQFVEGTLYLAAFAASGVSHADCAKKFFSLPGARGRVKFVDQALKSKLDPKAYDLSWLPIYKELGSFGFAWSGFQSDAEA